MKQINKSCFQPNPFFMSLHHRNSRTRMLALARDIVTLWGSKMVACEGKKLKHEYCTSVDYCEVCQSLWHFWQGQSRSCFSDERGSGE